jgi:hypothetical protein
VYTLNGCAHQGRKDLLWLSHYCRLSTVSSTCSLYKLYIRFFPFSLSWIMVSGLLLVWLCQFSVVNSITRLPYIYDLFLLTWVHSQTSVSNPLLPLFIIIMRNELLLLLSSSLSLLLFTVTRLLYHKQWLGHAMSKDMGHEDLLRTFQHIIIIIIIIIIIPLNKNTFFIQKHVDKFVATHIYHQSQVTQFMYYNTEHKIFLYFTLKFRNSAKKFKVQHRRISSVRGINLTNVQILCLYLKDSNATAVSNSSDVRPRDLTYEQYV